MTAINFRKWNEFPWHFVESEWYASTHIPSGTSSAPTLLCIIYILFFLLSRVVSFSPFLCVFSSSFLPATNTRNYSYTDFKGPVTFRLHFTCFQRTWNPWHGVSMASIHVCLQNVQYSCCFLNLKRTAVFLLQTDHRTVYVFVRHHLAVASVP